MPATMGTADLLLKEIYEPKVAELLNNDCPLLQMIDSSSEGVEQDTGHYGGRYVKFALHVTRNTGIGARNEAEDLPTPGNQGYINATEKLRNLYGVIQVTGQLVAFAEEKTESFLNAVTDEVDRISDDLSVDLNRQLWNDGTGKLGVTSSTGAQTTITLVTAADTRNFQIGMKVDVFTSANFTSNVTGTPAAAKGNALVTAIDTSAGTITLDTSITYAANDVLTRFGSVAREVYGLALLIGDSGTVHGINSALQPLWQSRVDHNSGTLRPISEGIIRNDLNILRTRGVKIPDIKLIFGLGVSSQYQNLLSAQRMNVNTREAAGGTSGMSFVTVAGGVEMKEDWTAPPNTMYGLNTKELRFADDGNFAWMNETGSRWQAVYGTNGIGKDMQSARIKRYLQFVNKKRNAHFVIKDLQES